MTDEKRFFTDLVRALRADGRPFTTIAEKADVSSQTLHNWDEGKVETPHLRTACRVARVLGLQVRLLRANEP